MIGVVSIQHTGTIFVLKLFNNQYHQAKLDEIPDRPSIHVGHISDKNIQAIKSLEVPIIVPFRHPEYVAESWKRRGKCLGILKHAYILLMNEIDPLNPYYLAVDSPKRDDQLNEINESLGLRLKTDWKPQNSVTETYNLSKTELTPMPTLLDVVGSLMTRLY